MLLTRAHRKRDEERFGWIDGINVSRNLWHRQKRQFAVAENQNDVLNFPNILLFISWRTNVFSFFFLISRFKIDGLLSCKKKAPSKECNLSKTLRYFKERTIMPQLRVFLANSHLFLFFFKKYIGTDTIVVFYVSPGEILSRILRVSVETI